MIPKKEGRKLRVDEFRLVSLSEVFYKIFGAIMREKLGSIVENNGWLREEHSGFSRGRQLEENLVLLSLDRESVEEKR